MNDNALVEKLWCHICREYESSITGVKNFSSAGIKGSTVLTKRWATWWIILLLNTKQHTTAMAWMQADNVKASKVLPTHYAIIAKCFPKWMLLQKKDWRKSLILAKENMAFLKYPVILELEECHRVDVGFAYRTKDSAKIFLLHSRKSTSILLCSGIFICQVF